MSITPKDCKIRSLSMHGQIWLSRLTAMPWRRVSCTPKQRAWQARFCIRACIFPSTIRLYLSWRTSLKRNCQCHSRKTRTHTVVEQGYSSHIRQIRFDGHICFWRAIRPSLHRTHRHDSAAYQEQSFANNRSDGGSKPEGVVSKSTRKAPDAVSYRAKEQRQPVCPDKVESCGWREESPPQDFSLFISHIMERLAFI